MIHTIPLQKLKNKFDNARKGLSGRTIYLKQRIIITKIVYI